MLLVMLLFRARELSFERAQVPGPRPCDILVWNYNKGEVSQVYFGITT